MENFPLFKGPEATKKGTLYGSANAIGGTQKHCSVGFYGVEKPKVAVAYTVKQSPKSTASKSEPTERPMHDFTTFGEA